jgi:hypothetical protein
MQANHAHQSAIGREPPDHDLAALPSGSATRLPCGNGTGRREFDDTFKTSAENAMSNRRATKTVAKAHLRASGARTTYKETYILPPRI